MRFSPSIDTQENYDNYLQAYGNAFGDGVNFLDDAMQEVARSDATHSLPVLLLTRHVIESIDGVQILASHGSVQPCEANLRSALEAFFGILYILESDSERRGLSYLVSDYRKHLKLHRKYDPSDPIGIELRAHNSADQIEALIGSIPRAMLQSKINFLETQLNEPEFKATNDEFARTKTKGEPNWYSLYGGPKHAQELARYLKLNHLYEFMYAPWSGTLHGGNTVRNLCDKGHSLGYRPIRHPDGMNTILRACMALGLPLAVQLFLTFSSMAKDLVMKRHADTCHRLAAVLETENVQWEA